MLSRSSTPETLLADDPATSAPPIVFTAPTFYRQMAALAEAAGAISGLRNRRVGRRGPARRHAAAVEAGHRHRDDRRHRRDRDAPHLHLGAGEDVRRGAIGKAVPGYEAAVVDDDDAAACPRHGRPAGGHGPTGCRYLADDRARRTTCRDGWNLTGDAFLEDADGYFFYQARADDMIISAGYNIAGPEVEDALLQHPAVAECAVIGAPDDERGQIVKAFVVLKPASGRTTRWRRTAGFRQGDDRAVQVPAGRFFRRALPRTETGKLKRFKLRSL